MHIPGNTYSQKKLKICQCNYLKVEGELTWVVIIIVRILTFFFHLIPK